MSCAVAVPNSPVFSPSSIYSIIRRTSVSSPETLTLTQDQDQDQDHPQSSSKSSFASLSSSCSPSSPSRFQPKNPASEFRDYTKECSSSSSSSSSSSLPMIIKRKRALRLNIPISSLSGYEARLVEEPRDVEVETDRFSVYCKRGRREVMEDRYSAVVDLHGDPKQAFFGVFDGHGGTKAAEFASKNMGKNIIEEVSRRGEEKIEDAVKHGYLTTDSEFLKEDCPGGTCCVTALIRKGDLVVSNAGDCRAVMSRRGIAEALTSDHRPSREDEKDRIEALGGCVVCFYGVWRLQGFLAVSRGIGDGHYKNWVTADPETKILRNEPECEFLILASDGLWDKVSNQEAVDIARPLCAGINKPETLTACKKLADMSVMRGSCDDITVMIIQLRSFT
ncbi:hypothetical protein HHK36_016171 [Tetracentron sinense]|uniref:protein-serine/threonine phosphatase n=1 Tax=Tetracentron sinense TaxID=13715 RepID=A0A835DBP8_TETSI|nr:hypothetical protein HHK36_016171 [Tetracentron sinense]